MNRNTIIFICINYVILNILFEKTEKFKVNSKLMQIKNIYPSQLMIKQIIMYKTIDPDIRFKTVLIIYE